MGKIEKIISIRGRKDIICVYNKYQSVSDRQDTGRPQATVDFIKHLASMPKDDETKRKLKAAVIAANQIDVGSIQDDAVPSNMKIIIQIEEDAWNTAMEVFRFAFSLAPDRNPQMPFLLKVAGMEFFRFAKEQNERLSGVEAMALDDFAKLDINEKLNEIYRLLMERKWDETL